MGQIELGSLALPPADDEEIELFDWTAAAAQSWAAAQDEVVQLRRALAERDAAVAKLRAQLADVAAAKRAHEEALLARFAALLNAKKRKVRDLQRVLAGAPADPAAARPVRGERGAPRGRKRKGEDGEGEESEGDDDEEEEEDVETEAGTDEDSESDAFEDAGAAVRRTPARAAAAVAEREPKREATPPPPPTPAPKVRRAIGGKKKQPAPAVAAAARPPPVEKDGAGGVSGGDVAMGGVEPAEAAWAPPPRRELPFMRAAASAPAAVEKQDGEPAGALDDETESDDEL